MKSFVTLLKNELKLNIRNMNMVIWCGIKKVDSLFSRIS